MIFLHGDPDPLAPETVLMRISFFGLCEIGRQRTRWYDLPF